MNKNEAMIERLKGREVKQCPRCGEYVIGLKLGDIPVYHECPICQNKHMWWEKDKDVWEDNKPMDKRLCDEQKRSND